jgi:AcrR family transcriptional regulator
MSKSRRKTSRGRPEPPRRRGPRFGTETWEATAGRIQDAAVQLVREEGLEGLNWRALGARPELDITGTAPLYYFGSKVGLLSAVAERGFEELTGRLRSVRAAATPGTDAIVSLSVAYARFGLENPHLYQAIHSAQLWHSTRADLGAAKRDWIQAARSARDRAFAEFSKLAQDAYGAGALANTPTDVAAQVLTALVDGYLFQALEENVDSTLTLDERLDYVALLVTMTLNGLGARAPR